MSALREAYEQWCEQLGERSVSANRLTQELQSRFDVADARGSKGQRFYTGVALLNDGMGGAFCRRRHDHLWRSGRGAGDR